MKSYIQVLTTPTADTPGSALLLHFDEQRYIFGNAHEGLQRANLQLGGKFLKARDVFVTGKTEWATNGGLLGMVLTLSDSIKQSMASSKEINRIRFEKLKAKYAAEQSSDKAQRMAPPPEHPEPPEEQVLRVHGGPNLTHTVAAARAFIFRNATPLEIKEHSGANQSTGQDNDLAPSWTDEFIDVWALPILPSCASDAERKLPCNTNEGEAEKRNQKRREDVVNQMFRSNWKFDNLVETPLHQVKLPAEIFVRAPGLFKGYERYKGPYPDGKKSAPDINVFVREPWPASMVDTLPPAQPSSIAMSYIVRTRQHRGKFRVEQAKKLKVPAGPLWAQLTRGEEVRSSDGKIVTPDMVLMPPTTPASFAVVELPSRDYVDAAIRRPEWQIESITKGVGAIVWLLGPGVIRNEKLQGFMKALPDVHHLVSSVETSPNSLAMTTAASGAIRRNKIDPIRFPDLRHTETQPREFEDALPPAERPKSLRIAQRGLIFHLEPKMKLQTNEIVKKFDMDSVVRDVSPNVLQLAQKAREEIASEPADVRSANEDLPSQDAEIICLGTGSALPSPSRNVSATLLRVPGYGSYLFDCGENTLGQLKRMYSPSELAEILHDLRLIWISHLHADHHLGTASVIKAWYQEVHGGNALQGPRNPSDRSEIADIVRKGRRLFLVGHSNMMRWLKEYSSVEDFGYDNLVPVECSNFVDGHGNNKSRLRWNGTDMGFGCSDYFLEQAFKQATGIQNLTACYVSHCFGSQAVSLRFKNGFKVSYSGDCLPSKLFAQIGEGSTVLIHEATFDDEMKSDAKAKKHSTISDAIRVGHWMGAKRILLTHFSQRYSKIPILSDLDKSPDEMGDSEDIPVLTAEPIDGDDEVDIPPDPSENLAPEGDLIEGLDAEGQSSKEAVEEQNPTTQPESPGPPETTEATAKNPHDKTKIAVAFDYMRIKVKDIAHMEKYSPVLQELFAAESPEAQMAKKDAARSDAGQKPKESKAGATGKEKAGTPKRKKKDADVEESVSPQPLKRKSVEVPEPETPQKPVDTETQDLVDEDAVDPSPSNVLDKDDEIRRRRTERNRKERARYKKALRKRRDSRDSSNPGGSEDKDMADESPRQAASQAE